MTKHRSLLYLFAVLIPVMAFSVFAARLDTDVRTEASVASQIEDGTVIALKYANDQIDESTRKTLTNRKELLKQQAVSDPKLFQEAVLTPEEYGAVSPILKELDLVEEPISKTGTLAMAYDENFETGEAKTVIMFEGYDAVLLNEFSEERFSPMTVTATGVMIDDTVYIQSIEGISEDDLPAASVQTVGDYSILAVQLSLNGAQGYIDNTYLETLFDDQNHPDSLYSFYKEVSYDLLHTRADVVGPIHITVSSLDSCDFESWTENYNEAIEQAGYSVDAYDGIFYVVDTGIGCGPHGRAMVGDGITWVVDIGGFDEFGKRAVLLHEFGHNVGMWHANYFDCEHESIAPRYDCHSEEYGESYDIMGNYYFSEDYYHPNGPHKLEAGWLQDDQVALVQEDGTYNISPIESAGGTKLIKLWRWSNRDYMYVSYRQPLLADSTLPETITHGASIHLHSDNWPTDLIDTTPESAELEMYDFKDASLSDGNELFEPHERIKIKQINHTSQAVTVAIEIPDDYNTPPEIEELIVPKKGVVGESILIEVRAKDYTDNTTAMVTRYIPGIDDYVTVDLSTTGTYSCNQVCSVMTGTLVFDEVGTYYLTINVFEEDPVGRPNAAVGMWAAIVIEEQKATPTIPGDTNGDGDLNASEWAVIFREYYNDTFDINIDSEFNGIDYGILVNMLGAGDN